LELTVFFAEYEKEGHLLYERFATAVADILAAALQPLPKIHVQQIQHRAKDPTSLSRKMADRNVAADSPLEKEIKDLAGCRVVLYTNSDVTRFEHENIVSMNFEIDWRRTKHHYPVPGTSSTDTPFVSKNYVVFLKEDRTHLAEYQQFAGLFCEIQIQTSLNHAWAETAHNILYKKPELAAFGTAAMKDIERRLNRIAVKYLRPAGDEFQKVRADFERLLAGKQLLDRNILRALAESNDNAERFELLGQFADKVLHNYDDILNAHDEIREAVKRAVRGAWEAKPSESDASKWPGADHIVDKAALILEQLRYVSVERAFDDVLEMYELSLSQTARSRWLQGARHLAEHNLEVWKKAGPIVQQLLVEHLLRLNVTRLPRPLVLETLDKILDTEVSGTRMASYQSVVISRGSVVVSPALQKVRDSAIDLLEELLVSAANDGERQYAANILMSMWRLRFTGSPNQALVETLLRDAKKVIDVFQRHRRPFGHFLCEHIEHRLWYLRYYARSLPQELRVDDSVKQSLDALFVSIDELRTALGEDEDFSTFKILYGHEAIFPPQWEAESFDFEIQRAYRIDAVEKLIAGISQSNLKYWRRRLLACATIRSGDGADPLPLCDFLRKLGSTRPSLSLKLVRAMDGDLSRYSWALLEGIDQAASTFGDLHELIAGWINRKEHLREVAIFFAKGRSEHLALVQTAMEGAIVVEDLDAVRQLVDVVARRAVDLPKSSVPAILLLGVSYLSNLADFTWVDTLWMTPNAKPLFALFEDADIREILSYLEKKLTISDSDSRLLARFAAHAPRYVVEFFAARVRIGNANELSAYQAIPFELGELREPLRNHARGLLDVMAEWHAQDAELFSFRGGRLLASIFGDAHEEIGDALIDHVQTHEIDNIPFVVAVLDAFNGDVDVTETCRIMVEVLPEGHEYLRDVQNLLFQVGSTTGEYGLVKAYKEVMARVAQWQTSDSIRVRRFAEDFLHSIEQIIASEQQAADERLQQRKLGFRGSESASEASHDDDQNS
jgi:ppGpp synthetase/RelA/SpoT-type nucleotidyltranferase